MTFMHLQMFSPFPMTTLHKSSSFLNQPSSNARSQSRLATSLTINFDLQSIFDWGIHNFVKFDTYKTQLLTISPSNSHSNYPILFEDNEILPPNSAIVKDFKYPFLQLVLVRPYYPNCLLSFDFYF